MAGSRPSDLGATELAATGSGARRGVRASRAQLVGRLVILPPLAVTPREDTADMALALSDPTIHRPVRHLRPVRHRSGRERPRRCRATRRRQRVAGLVVVALGTGGFVAATEAVAAVGRVLIDPSAAPPPAEGDWVVRPVTAGESLWSIAASHSAAGDLRPRVDELVRINGGAALTAGQMVRIPTTWMEDAR